MTEIGSTGRNGGSLVQNTRRNRKKVSRDQEITFSSDSYTYITFLPLLISTKIATVGQAENWNQRNELMPVDVTYDLRSSVSNKTALRIFSQTYSLQFHDKKSFIFRLFSATILLYRPDTAIERFFISPNQSSTMYDHLEFS